MKGVAIPWLCIARGYPCEAESRAAGARHIEPCCGGDSRARLCDGNCTGTRRPRGDSVRNRCQRGASLSLPGSAGCSRTKGGSSAETWGRILKIGRHGMYYCVFTCRYGRRRGLKVKLRLHTATRLRVTPTDEPFTKKLFLKYSFRHTL